MQRKVVVFPHPLGPSKTTNSSSLTSKLRSLRAGTSSYAFARPRNSTRAKASSDGEERINNLRLPPGVADGQGRPGAGTTAFPHHPLLARLPSDLRRAQGRRLTLAPSGIADLRERLSQDPSESAAEMLAHRVPAQTRQLRELPQADLRGDVEISERPREAQDFLLAGRELLVRERGWVANRPPAS